MSMPQNLALVLFAGPEMPCKLQHAILFARDSVARGGHGTVILEGQSPRWLLELATGEHPMSRVFAAAVQEGLVMGVCKSCAAMHGAQEAVARYNLPLLDDAYGHVSLSALVAQGYQAIVI
jgi:hypothetical protein